MNKYHRKICPSRIREEEATKRSIIRHFNIKYKGFKQKFGSGPYTCIHCNWLVFGYWDYPEDKSQITDFSLIQHIDKQKKKTLKAIHTGCREEYRRTLIIEEETMRFNPSMLAWKVYDILLSDYEKVIPEQQFGKYFIDFFLPEEWVGVEVDGDYWHPNTDEQKEIEKSRDKYIFKNFGINVVRIVNENAIEDLYKHQERDKDVIIRLREIYKNRIKKASESNRFVYSS
ncbi:MAG TPA: DUF559 domain-containing protein [bacterium]|nr:DUF559 domain-containing protein [bacterium]